MTERTLFDKVWDEHAILERNGVTLLAIDRHLLYEVTADPAFRALERAGRSVRHPELSLATIDHIVATAPGRTGESYAAGAPLVRAHRDATGRHRIRLLDLDDPRQGIVHVAASELGAVLPGTTAVCGDSHTCTLGALGALAFGIGSSDVELVLATQALWVKKPRRMRVTLGGAPAAQVGAKDLALHLIAALGASAGNGFAVEYCGDTLQALPFEARFTLCNLSVEFGARIGMVAPDPVALDWLATREFAPHGTAWEQALAHWRTLAGDAGARFDREVHIDSTRVAPMITWGTSPEHAIGIGEAIPEPADAADAQAAAARRKALEYMGLTAGDRIEGLPIDVAFIGSCTNARVCDLREAASIVAGRRVAGGVRALVVPGSARVRRDAEREGLDRVFREAGFEWHEAGCSMCCALGPDRVPPGRRSISTSNRNFENRQGPGARTHLASPQSVAAAAIAGRIVDVRAVAR